MHTLRKTRNDIEKTWCGSEVHMQILGFHRPVRCEHHLHAAAEGPSDSPLAPRDSSQVVEGTYLAERKSARQIKEPCTQAGAHSRSHGAQRMEVSSTLMR